MSKHPRRRRHLLPGGSLLVLAAIVCATSVFHVPDGWLAASGGRLFEAGWHLKPPLRSVRRFPLFGRIEAIDVDPPSEDGIPLRIRLSFNYAVTLDRLAGRAAEVEASGVAGVARRIVASEFKMAPIAALVPGGLTGAGGRSLLPGPLRTAAASALREAGIEPIDFDARIGPVAAFATLDAAREAAEERADRTHEPAPMPERHATGLRLLLIGLDGADWEIIDPLVRAGRLPHLGRLLENGARASMRSYDPMISPLLWTTMVTGVGPDRHGIADFQAIEAGSGRLVPITSRFRKVKALWNILGDAGIDTAFVAWWASYPAEQVRGVQVSNLLAYDVLYPRSAEADPASGLTFPAGYMEHIRPSLVTAAEVSFEEVRSILTIDRPAYDAAQRELGAPPDRNDVKARRELLQQPIPLTMSILASSRNYTTIATDLAAGGRSLTAVYFEGIDMIGHRFQHCMPPRRALCPEEDYQRYRDAVNSFYVHQDALLGEILQAAGEDTTVMLVSDHGFKSGEGRPIDDLPYTTQQPVEWHDREGIFILSGPGARRGVQPAERVTLFDVAPTILYLIGLPVSEEMTGRIFLPSIDPGFAQRHPPRIIRSYESVGPPRGPRLNDRVAGDDDASSRRAEDDLLATLQALGYLGGDSDGPAPAADDPERGAPRAAGIGNDPGAGRLDETGSGNPAGAATQVFYHRNLATYFLKRNEYARAAEQLRLANQRRRLPKTYQMLSEAYLGMGRRQEAIDVLNEGLETIPEADPESVLWLVRIALAVDGGASAARKTIERYGSRTASKPGLDDAIAGLMLGEGGDPAGAIRHYRRSLQADPLRVFAARQLYALEPAETRGTVLEPLLRRALTVDPRIDEYHNLLGIILAGREQLEASKAAFRRAADLDPDNPRFAANLAGALVRLERWDEAARYYERAVIMAPSAATAMKLGSVYRRLNRPEMALAAFQRARALGDTGRGPILGIALAHSEMDQVADALAVLREGLESHPEDDALRTLHSDLNHRLQNRSPRAGSGS